MVSVWSRAWDGGATVCWRRDEWMGGWMDQSQFGWWVQVSSVQIKSRDQSGSRFRLGLRDGEAALVAAGQGGVEVGLSRLVVTSDRGLPVHNVVRQHQSRARGVEVEVEGGGGGGGGGEGTKDPCRCVRSRSGVARGGRTSKIFGSPRLISLRKVLLAHSASSRKGTVEHKRCFCHSRSRSGVRHFDGRDGQGSL